MCWGEGIVGWVELLRNPSRASPLAPKDDGFREELNPSYGSMRNDRRRVSQRSSQRPEQEQHHRRMHDELQERVSDDIARLQAQYGKERQHPERVDEIRQRFGRIVD